MTVFVQRDLQGRVTGVFRNRQSGYAEEALEDSDPEVVAFELAPSALSPLTPRQLRLMMLQLGLPEQQVLDVMEAIPDAGERAAALIEWNWATHYKRDHPLVAMLATALGIQPNELDDLWAYAAGT